MKTIVPAKLLRAALYIDAIGSSPMAALHLALGPWLAAQTRLAGPLLLETGLFMVVYVAVLLVLARAPRLPTVVVAAIAAGNVGWAAAAVGLMALLSPSGLGVALLAAHALATLAFAALQFAGLRASAAADPAVLAVAR